MWGGDVMKGTWDYYNDYYSPGPQTESGVYSTEYFRENLREIMIRLDLTQAEAAKRCELSQALIQKWLAGESEPSLYSFTKLCSGLGIEPNWLLSKHELIKRKGKTNDKA